MAYLALKDEGSYRVSLRLSCLLLSISGAALAEKNGGRNIQAGNA